MDTNNKWPTPPSREPYMDTVDWRTQFPLEMRQKIVNRIISTLRQHYPLHHQEDLDELRKITIRFEEKILLTSSSQNDYIMKIFSKMLRMVESKSPNPMPNTANNSKAPDPGFQGMQNQVHSQGQAISSLLQNNQSQARQQLLPQNVPNNMTFAGVQTCAGSQSGALPLFGSKHNPISNVDGLNSNMQNISGNSLGQGMPPHGYAHQQRQMQGKQQELPQQQQRQQQLLINFTNTNKPRKLASALQQGQLPPPHMYSMPQPQTQIHQTRFHDNQMNPRLLSMDVQGSVPTMPNNMTSLQHNSLSSLPGVSRAEQIMLNSLHLGSDLESGQGNALGSMQPVAPEPLLQNPVSSSSKEIISSLSSQSHSSVLQQNMNPLQSNSDMLQQQHLKQHQDQQMLLSRQHPNQQDQQRRMQQQLDHQAKQQLPKQLKTHQMPQLHQINDVNDIMKRQGVHVNQGAFEQHLPAGQRQSYSHLQLKTGFRFPFSSPQRLQATTRQTPQHSSPQVDQQSQRISISKTGTALHSANSPFVIPSPSTPLAPSPIPGESENSVPGTSSISNAANVGHYQGTVVQAVPQSLAICTPVISASPLLAESPGADANHANALETVSSNSNIPEQPLERLMKAVKSMSPAALGAAVSDIAFVVGMTDGIAGSTPGNGARAAIGQDLVAMTKCRLRTRNFFTQDGMRVTKKMRRDITAMPLS